MGVNAGDNINYYRLCISHTSAVTDIDELAMALCDSSKNGLVVFRMDSNNPNQGTLNLSLENGIVTVLREIQWFQAIP